MRSRRLSLLSLGAMLAAWPLAAQGSSAPRPPRPSRPDSMTMAMDSMLFRLDTLQTRSRFFRDSLQSALTQAFAMRRVRIGVVVQGLPAETDSIGALIIAVTPGGPAANAGLLAGDVVTRFGATSLAVPLDKVSPGTRVLSPGFQFAELVAKLAPNDTVAVEYRRGKAKRSTRVVAAADQENLTVVVGPGGSYGFSSIPGGEAYWVGGDQEGNQRALELTLRRSEMARGGRGQDDAGMPRMQMGQPMRDLELATVNPQLGSYFGTTDGVLVVDVPDPAPLGLKAGDVVLAVDGRTVSSPRQLVRVLDSYDPGEPLQLEVMRQKKRTTLKGVLGR